MKRLIPAFVLFNIFSVSAQSKDIEIQWTDSFYAVGENSYFIPSFQKQMFRFDSAKKVLGASVVMNQVNGNSVRVVTHKLQSIDITKYPDINTKNIPSNIDEKVVFYLDKGVKNAVVSFNPIIKTANGYSRVTDVNFEITNDAVVRSKVSQNLVKSKSVLATGNWFKFKINDTGVYRLSKKFLTDLGIPDNVDPRTIKIYGYGGNMLPIANENNVNFDLPEIAIQFNGEQDGTLDTNDYVLFYGIGTSGWNSENATHLNLYSKEAYYFVTYGNETGKRIQSYIQPSTSSTEIYTDYVARVYMEEDKTNITQLSRKWFGQNFNDTSNGRLSFSLQTPFLNSSKPLTVATNVALVSTNLGFFNLTLNDQSVGAINLNGKNGSSLAFEGYLKKEMNSQVESNVIHIDFNNNGVPTARGFVDFVAIDYYKHLVGHNKQFKFSFPSAVTNIGTASFKINNAQSISQVWNVTDSFNPLSISNTTNSFEVKFQMGKLEEFVAVDVNDYLSPILIPNSKVVNQDLKGSIFKDGDVDYLIITNNNLLSAAQRLATIHKTKNNLNVKVVSLDVIYNEFSSGQQDVVAVRNFIRYVYHAGNQTLKYVNLFGDASTDYLDRIQNNSNQVPIFQTLDNSLHNNSASNFNDQSSFGSDDFYALLDEGEEIKFWGDHLGLDVAVGRVPVNTIQEANNVVNKIDEYLSSENVGRWKNNYTALADDVDNPFDEGLQLTLNGMVDELVKNKPYFNVKKVMADSYQQQVVAGGPRYPKAKEDFLSGINNGSLVVNYLGHGSETLLGQEQFLDLNDVDQLKNTGKYPLFAIITCDFTRFDNPLLKSGGERLFLRDKAGAIGIMATTRKIGISHAQEFTTNLSAWLFGYNNTLPQVSMAEALMLTKNDVQKPVSEKGVVAFIGDPALKLALPKPDITITHINSEPIQNFTGSLRALDRILLKGNVTSESGQVISNFNGDLAVQIFDKNIEKTTLLNDKGGYAPGVVINPMKFSTLGETFFRGNATVTNGVFEIEFVVPKDIKIAIGEGKVSFYAKKDATALDDYTGANTTIKVGGVNENAQEDNKPPQIKLFMNDESFISGGVTNNAPLFLAHLEDENGMNTASGIGHDMVAILDGDENNPIVMNEFYETEPNNFMKGFVNYPFSNLKEGLHTISFKAWDAYNNLATATLDFVVTASTGLQLDRVLNYPNPFVDYTEFWFQHNRPNETLQVQVQILTVTGKIVRTINQTVVSQGLLSKDIKWDGRDDFGDKIGKGVYIYKLKVKATESGQEAEKFEKLVVL